MIGIAVPPKADNPRLDSDFFGDRAGAAPVRRQQNYPRPLQIALQRHRRAATRLKHLAIFPRKVDFSCFRYHPYLESRLTIQGKWVLVSASRVMAGGCGAPTISGAVRALSSNIVCVAFGNRSNPPGPS